MANSVNKIPSINVPFTDKKGRITPVWHEFLRAFVASTVESTNSTTTNAGLNIVAGAGLRSVEDTDDITLSVGAGDGLEVNANDVSIDIDSLTYTSASLDDSVPISDSNNLRRTTVQDIINLVPEASSVGGSNGQIQYNDNGEFGGDTGFTTDGAGTVTIDTQLNVEGISLTGGATEIIRFDGETSATAPRIQTDGGGGYKLYAKTLAPNEAYISLNGSASTISLVSGTGSSGQITFNDTQGFFLSGSTVPLRRSLETNLTANTTQTQGNGALTRDYNIVTTVDNANDVVTLPAAIVGRYCLVKNEGANILQVYPASGDDLGFGVDVSTTIRPGAHFSWYTKDSTTWHQMDGLHRKTVRSGITASTTQTQGQGPLTHDVNEVSTVANANDTVTLPTATSFSRTITIINNGANTLKIYPASGDNLGAGVDTSTTLASGANVRYTNYDVTNWENI